MTLLEGRDLAPSEFMAAEDEKGKPITIPNPDYEVWVDKDQRVMSFLVNSLSEEVLPNVFRLEHAADVWRALTSLY